MYQGKFRKSKSRRLRPVIVLASLILVLTVSITGTLAYLTTDSGPVNNTFAPSGVPNKVVETITGSAKEDVKIQNVGNIDAYIRAEVVFNWTDEQGNYSGIRPVEGTDYTIKWAKDGWTEGQDGYFYYTSRVSPDDFTGVLFTDCKVVEGKAPAGFPNFTVTVVGQSIQADGVDANGTKAVVLAWGVDPETLS